MNMKSNSVCTTQRKVESKEEKKEKKKTINHQPQLLDPQFFLSCRIRNNNQFATVG